MAWKSSLSQNSEGDSGMNDINKGADCSKGLSFPLAVSSIGSTMVKKKKETKEGSR